MADMDGNGTLDFNEWQIATLDMRSVLTDKRMKEAFALFDKVIFIFNIQDRGGTITADEIKQVLGVGRKIGNEKMWDELL